MIRIFFKLKGRLFAITVAEKLRDMEQSPCINFCIQKEHESKTRNNVNIHGTKSCGLKHNIHRIG